MPEPWDLRSVDQEEEARVTAAVAAGTPTSPALMIQADDLLRDLEWIAIRTRPDLEYALAKMRAVLTTNPARASRMAKEVMKYLRSSMDIGIFMPNKEELAQAKEYMETPLIQHYDATTVVTYSNASLDPRAETWHQGIDVRWGSMRLDERSTKKTGILNNRGRDHRWQ